MSVRHSGLDSFLERFFLPAIPLYDSSHTGDFTNQLPCVSETLLKSCIKISYKKHWGSTEVTCSQARPDNYETSGRRDSWEDNDRLLNVPLGAAATATFASEWHSSSNKSRPYLWSRSPERRMRCYVSLLDLLHRESRTLSQLRAGMFQGDTADRVWSHQKNIHLVSTDLEEEEHTCFTLFIVSEGVFKRPRRIRNPAVKLLSSLRSSWEPGFQNRHNLIPAMFPLKLKHTLITFGASELDQIPRKAAADTRPVQYPVVTSAAQSCRDYLLFLAKALLDSSQAK